VPREVIRAADHDRDLSLGWLALAWMEALVVHGPGDVQGEPVVHGDEMSEFVADCYALGGDGRRRYDSAFYSRPKGGDKSGLGARLCLFEALGPARFDGWAQGGEVYTDPFGLGFSYTYDAGEPMGRPVKVPYIRCMATEEGQTGNVYDTIHFNLTEAPLSQAMGRKDDAGLTRIWLPGGGEITPSTASSSSKDGGKETFVDFDETHLYNTPELRRMYATVTRNLRKRKKIAETWFVETTTMFAAGQESSAEATYHLAEKIREGKAKRQRLLFDHRWGDCDDLTDEVQLRSAITEAFGDAMAWNDLDGLVNEFFEGRSATKDSRRYFLNSPSSSINAWLMEYEWNARGPGQGGDGAEPPAKRDVITLGFDGSRKRARGVTDATALIGCRVRDGHVFQLRVWEQPDDQEDWQVPVTEVEAEVREAFATYDVVGFYADPAKWETVVAGWEASYGSRLKIKATAQHPIQWWMTGGRASMTVRALEKFESAVLDGELTHDGASALTRHVLNARRIVSTRGIQIGKPNPDSPHKIDAAVAAVLAWQARLDAMAAGLGKTRSTFVPSRIR
jgi:hypothetical protein